VGPTCAKRRRAQTDFDLAAELTRLQFANVHASDEPWVESDSRADTATDYDVYLLCGGKYRLALPKPPPLERGWAERPERTLTLKTPAQALLLLEEFLKNKAAGRAERKSNSALLEELNKLGPELDDKQIESHFRALQQAWNVSDDGMQARLGVAKAAVLQASQILAEERSAEAAAVLSGQLDTE
jgi:hypothetical protein